MERRYIMTAFGKDRPGVAADVTRLLYEHGCNLEDTTMTRLADEFALILLFTSRARDAAEALAKGCRRLEREKGISAFFREAEASDEGVQTGDLRTIHVEGIDHTGIVHRVSGFLARRGINIENLSSKLVHSPESGTARYRMEISAQLPKGVDEEALRRDFEVLGDELNVDIAF